MRRLALLALAAAALGSCKCSTPAPSGPQLANEMKRALADRERRLTSYHVVVTSKEGDAEAAHQFFYRAPNKVRGVLEKPQALTLAFDGTTLFKLLPEQKTLYSYAMKLPRDKAAFMLASQFSPFVPEGYRTPLLPSTGVTAQKVKHPKGPEAVELTVSTGLGPDAVRVTYVLRWPSADFLGKRTTLGGQTSELTVDEEVCDQALKLCVPKVVTEREGGAVVATTTITTVELNPELPAEGFTLTAPPGFATETHELVEAADGG